MESIYHKPISDITWDDVEQFCEQRIPEGAVLDYKREIPERLENTIAAMANTIGGVILVGIDEDSETRPKRPLNGVPFKKGLEEQVINMILSNITPPMFPEIGVVLSEDKTKAIVIVRIHQSHETPHAIAQNTRVYLRTGNRNDPEERATVDKIEWLLNGRRRSETLRNSLYDRAEKRFDTMRGAQRDLNISTGVAILRLSICPMFPKDVYRKPPELKQLLYGIRVPAVNDLFGVTFPATAMVTMVQDAVLSNQKHKSSDFSHTELNGFGLFFYKQTLSSALWLESAFESTEIFARLDEFFDSAILFYSALGYGGHLHIRISLENISDKKLIGYLEASRSLGGDFTCVDPHIQHEQVALAHSLDQQKSVLIHDVVQRIGWAFNWEIAPELLDQYYQFSKPKSPQ